MLIKLNSRATWSTRETMIQLYLICLYINKLRGLMRECNLQTHTKMRNSYMVMGYGLFEVNCYVLGSGVLEGA